MMELLDAYESMFNAFWFGTTSEPSLDDHHREMLEMLTDCSHEDYCNTYNVTRSQLYD